MIRKAYKAPQWACSRVDTKLRNTCVAGRAGNKGTSYTFICDEEEECTPDLVMALQETGAAVPRDLMEIANNFIAEQRHGQVHAHGSGYSAEEEELRRLGFVLGYCSKASGCLTYVYSQARTYVPENLRPQLVSWEHFASKHGQPLVNKLADRGQEILQVADNQVRIQFASIQGSNGRIANVTAQGQPAGSLILGTHSGSEVCRGPLLCFRTVS